MAMLYFTSRGKSYDHVHRIMVMKSSIPQILSPGFAKVLCYCLKEYIHVLTTSCENFPVRAVFNIITTYTQKIALEFCQRKEHICIVVFAYFFISLITAAALL
jgi:hypothetical protein